MSRKLGFRALGLLMAMALFMSTAGAHEFLVKIANTNPKAGEDIDAELHNTHAIIGPSEEETGDGEAEAEIVGRDSVTPLALRDDPATLTTKVLGANREAETSWLAVHRKPQLWSQTTDGMIRTDKGDAGEVKILFTNKYEKFAKVLLNANASADFYKTKVGHLLEIVPEQNPASVKPGATIQVKTFHDGKAVAAEYIVARDGADMGGSSHDLETEKAGAEGLTVSIDQAGMWVIIAKIQIPGGEGIRTHNLNAALEFEVK